MEEEREWCFTQVAVGRSRDQGRVLFVLISGLIRTIVKDSHTYEAVVPLLHTHDTWRTGEERSGL